MAVDHKNSIIEVSDVSFSYEGHEALSHIDLSIHKGDYLALVGGNGAGKTTLVKIILGLLSPTEGTVKLFGKSLQDFKDWSKIGYVPQKASSFDASFPATVEEIVMMGRFGRRGLFHKTTIEDRNKARLALERLGLLGVRERQIGDLSGGQQQRAMIARALAGEPEVLFLDEPTVGVEDNVKEEFYKTLQSLNREMGLTIVLVTHDVSSVAKEAMHVACVDKTLVFHDSVDKYFEESHRSSNPHRHA